MVEGELSSVVSDFKHIVIARINSSASNFFGSFCKVRHHFFLERRRFYSNIVVMRSGRRQVKCVRRPYISHLLKHRHQFGQIVKLRKACFRSVSRSFGFQFISGHGFAEGGSPSVEVLQVVFKQGVILQISLYGVKLYHRITDRRSCCEYCSSAARQLVKVSAFHNQVGAFMRFGLCDTADVSHFGCEKQILVVMALVNKEPVNTQLLKGNNIVLAALVVELLQFGLERLFALFKLLDREVFSLVRFQLGDTVGNIVNLLFKQGSLTLQAHRDFLKLRVSDNDSVIVACRYSSAEAFAVCRFKILLRRYQNISRRIEL